MVKPERKRSRVGSGKRECGVRQICQIGTNSALDPAPAHLFPNVAEEYGLERWSPSLEELAKQLVVRARSRAPNHRIGEAETNVVPAFLYM